MDKLAAMATFVEIAERGSLTAAADAVGRSLPTVVRTLAELERTLGTRLANRTTRRLALTDEGQRYVAHCRRILAEVREAELELSERRTEPAGHITVSAPVMFGTLHVAPAVARFLAGLPAVQVDLVLLDRVVDLLEEGVDLAVRIAPLADSGLVARTVGEVRRVVCASPGLLERCGEPEHPRELERLPCVRSPLAAAGGVWRFRDGRKRIGIKPRGAFHSNQIPAVIEACRAGLGFGCFLSYQVEALVAAGELRLVLDAFELPPAPIALVHAHGRRLPTRIRVLRDHLAAALAAPRAVSR